MSSEMKDSGFSSIGYIPNGWYVTKIKMLADIYTGTSISDDIKDKYILNENAIPYISTKDLDVSLKIIDYDNGLFIPKGEKGFRLAEKDSTLLCIEGGSAGKKIAFTDRDVNFVNKLCCIKSKQYNNKFIYYYVNSSAFTEQFNINLSGLIGGVSINLLKQIFVVVPPIEEQKNISTYLDKKVSQIDDIISKQKSLIEKYKSYKQSLITETVTKGLNKNVPVEDSGIQYIGFAPKTWNIVKIKYLLEERNDKSSTGDEEQLSMSQKFGLIKTKDMDMIPNLASSLIGNKKVMINDLVFNKLKAHLGVFAVSRYEGIVSPDYAVYFSGKEVNIKFLEFLFKTQIYINEFKKHSKGVGQGLTRLYTSDLFNIKCAIPNLEEQDIIVDFLDKKCNAIDSAISKKEQLISKLGDYKKSLIYECVTGKREVN